MANAARLESGGAMGTSDMILEHMPTGTKLRLSEVKELFELMR